MDALELGFHPPREDAARYSYAFLELPGSTPVSLARRTGCCWPISEDTGDPLKQPVTRLFCDNPSYIGKSPVSRTVKLHPYCIEHMRVAYRTFDR